MRDVPVGVSDAQFILQRGRAVCGGRVNVRLLGGADRLSKPAVR
jgi:hypothetical protein